MRHEAVLLLCAASPRNRTICCVVALRYRSSTRPRRSGSALSQTLDAPEQNWTPTVQVRACSRLGSAPRRDRGRLRRGGRAAPAGAGARRSHPPRLRRSTPNCSTHASTLCRPVTTHRSPHNVALGVAATPRCAGGGEHRHLSGRDGCPCGGTCRHTATRAPDARPPLRICDPTHQVRPSQPWPGHRKVCAAAQGSAVCHPGLPTCSPAPACLTCGWWRLQAASSQRPPQTNPPSCPSH